MLDEFPAIDGFVTFVDPWIVPLSLQECWETFYAEGAPHPNDKLSAAAGANIVEFTKRQDPDVSELKKYKEWMGQPVQKYNRMKTVFPLPPNPLISEVASISHIMLMKKEDTLIEITKINTTKGFPFADSVSMEEHLEVRTADPRSRQSVFRHTYKLTWKIEPYSFVETIVGMLVRLKGVEFTAHMRDYLTQAAEEANAA